MDLDMKQNSINCFNKIVSLNVSKEAVQEMVVPDTMPDIAEILETSALLMIRSKDIESGCAKIEANVVAKVIYRPDSEEKVSVLEITLPFSVSIEDEKIENGSDCCAKLYICSLDCKMANPRKVVLKAELTGNISCYLPGEIKLNSDADNSSGVYIQQQSRLITPVKDVREKTFVVTDEYTLPAIDAPAAQLLGSGVQLNAEDTKLSGGKLILKGSAIYKTLYLGTDQQLHQSEFTTPFSQVIDVPELTYDLKPEIYLMLTGAYFEIIPESDNKGISSELHMLAQVVSREKEEIKFVSDAYSNSYELELSNDKLMTPVQLMQTKFRKDQREQLGSMLQIKELLAVSAIPGKTELKADGIKLPVNYTAVYLGSDSMLHSVKRRTEVFFEINSEINTEVDIICPVIGSIQASVNSGTIEIHTEVEMEIAIYKPAEIEFISAIERSDNAIDISSKPSITIMRANSETDLWCIAKDNCSSVESIVQVNKLSDIHECWDKFILIPKTK